MMELTDSLVRRFWEKVVKNDDEGCWIWVGSKDRKGYGRINVGRQQGGYPALAHRLSWLLNNGTDPDGKFVCHSCDTPACVNPRHLWLGGVADNQRDMSLKGRARGKISLGESNGHAALTADTVRLIRRLSREGMRQRDIARIAGTNQSHVSRILLGKSWAHLHDH